VQVSDLEEERDTLPSSGILYLIVNDTIVVTDSRVLKDVFPGQPIRYPAESKGRYQLVDVNGRGEIHAVPAIDTGHAAGWTQRTIDVRRALCLIMKNGRIRKDRSMTPRSTCGS